MKEIARVFDVGEAIVVANYLRAQGFEVMLPEEYHLGVAPHLSFGFGGYRILVGEEDADDALAALDEKRPKPKHQCCRKCGSEDIRRAKQWWLPVLLFVLAEWAVPFARGRRDLVCRACGYTWKDNDNEPSDDV